MGITLRSSIAAVIFFIFGALANPEAKRMDRKAALSEQNVSAAARHSDSPGALSK